MAAIVSSGGSAGASPIAVSSTNAPTSATTGKGGAATSLTDMFTQLIAAMTSANAATQQGTSQPATADLAGLDLGVEGLELTNDDRDTDTDDKSDDDEAGALAVAALLPDLAAPTPALPAPTTPAATGAIEGAFIARRADLDVTEAAVEELTGDSSDGTSKDASADASQTPVTSSTATAQTPQQTPVHALLASHAAAAVADAPDTTISSPVGSATWKDELGTQLTWMAINGREAASLKLSPEHLGPLEVRISVREGEASVNFVASSPDTRSAIEQSLPRLRELFASQGMVLTDAGVSRDAPRNAFRPAPDGRGSRGNSDASNDTSVKSITLARAGLIDTYV